MSFILDALRKSEHDRQRQTGPALAEVPVAQPKSQGNRWATAAMALLLVNLVAVGVLLLRKAGEEAEPAAIPATAPPAAAPATASPAPAQVSMTQTVAPPSTRNPPPPMLQPARTAEPPASGPRNPLQDEVAVPPEAEPELSAGAATPPAGPPAVTRSGTKRGSVVYQALPDDAVLGGGAAAAAAVASVSRPPAAGPRLPTADELAAAGGVPVLNLDLHVYATNPSERMAFINGRRYREGDTLQEGAVVRQITPDGVVLEMNGRAFLLGRD